MFGDNNNLLVITLIRFLNIMIYHCFQIQNFNTFLKSLSKWSTQTIKKYEHLILNQYFGKTLRGYTLLFEYCIHIDGSAGLK